MIALFEPLPHEFTRACGSNDRLCNDIQSRQDAGSWHDHLATAKPVGVSLVLAVTLLALVVVAFVGPGPQITRLWTGRSLRPDRIVGYSDDVGYGVSRVLVLRHTSLLTGTDAHLSLVGVLLVAGLPVAALCWPAGQHFGCCWLQRPPVQFAFGFAGGATNLTLRKEGMVDLVREVARRGRWS